MSISTIAAVGTALSNSGISIIRISGKYSLNIIKKIFNNSDEIKPNKIIYGKILENEEMLDNVLVSYFKAPKSFTGEDVCEINCHGGVEITRQILELVLKSGAVLATPGEFSKRAFLNGKMDLLQAESVISLINSKTKIQTKIATNQLDGKLSNKIKELRMELIELLAQIEVNIDYPEYDYEEIENTVILNNINKILESLKKIVNTYEQGKYIKDGVNVAILGRPNVGKSSLLNKLANYDKAIVTDIPGTTRDIVEETINIGNIILNISDTAGIRETEDIIEKIGVEKSLKKLEEVDLVIYMLNAKEKITESDLNMLSKIQNKGIKYIIVINKVDETKKQEFDLIMEELEGVNIKNCIGLSVYTGEGVEKLKEEIINLFNKNDFDFEHELIITNQRHKNLLIKAIDYLNETKNELINNKPLDIIEIYIKNTTKSLGEITGESVSQDVINKIFEKFCLGK